MANKKLPTPRNNPTRGGKKPKAIVRPKQSTVPVLTIKVFSDHTLTILGDTDTVNLMNIIVNTIPLEMRKMIAVAGENNDIIERILIRACSKTLRTGRPF